MDINVKELKEKLEKEEAFVLIDVREPHEHEEFNIGGDLIPLGNFPGVINELEEHKDKEVVVYCRSGRRSAMAKQLFERSGFNNVRNLEGGILAWQENFGEED